MINMAFIYGEILSKGNIASYITGIMASGTWELFKSRHKDKYEDLLIEAIAETFQKYYEKKAFEFNYSVVMNSFFDAISEENNADKVVLSKTVGMEQTDEDLKIWENIFSTVISQDKYSVVYKKLLISEKAQTTKSEAYLWMEKNVRDNFCCRDIDFTTSESHNNNIKIIEALSGIDNILLEQCWTDTMALLIEIYLNAYMHGNASHSELVIESKSITFIDDGKEFDVLSLKNYVKPRGGSLTLSSYLDEYKEVDIKSFTRNKKNYFSINFKESVFAINSKCQIEKPDIETMARNFEYSPSNHFKYQYIDIRKVVEDEDGFYYFSNISSQYRVLPLLSRGLVKGGKLFIIFPHLKSGKLESVHKMLEKAMKISDDVNQIEIVDL